LNQIFKFLRQNRKVPARASRLLNPAQVIIPAQDKVNTAYIQQFNLDSMYVYVDEVMLILSVSK